MEEKEFASEMSEWDYDEEYNGGYYNRLHEKRTRRLIECFPPMSPIHPDYDRERATYMESHPWCSREDYDSLSQEGDSGFKGAAE